MKTLHLAFELYTYAIGVVCIIALGVNLYNTFKNTKEQDSDNWVEYLLLTEDGD